MESLSERFETAVDALGQRTIARAEVDAFLKDFGAHIGLAALALDDDGIAQITIDSEVELSLFHFPDLPGLVVGTPLPNLPTAQPAYLKTLMQANMSWRLTRGGLFAMLPGVDEAMLCWLLLIGDHDVRRVDREMAEIVDFAKFWVAEIDAAIEAERSLTQDLEAVRESAVRA